MMYGFPETMLPKGGGGSSFVLQGGPKLLVPRRIFSDSVAGANKAFQVPLGVDQLEIEIVAGGANGNGGGAGGANGGYGGSGGQYARFFLFVQPGNWIVYTIGAVAGTSSLSFQGNQIVSLLGNNGAVPTISALLSGVVVPILLLGGGLGSPGGGIPAVPSFGNNGGNGGSSPLGMGGQGGGGGAGSTVGGNGSNATGAGSGGGGGGGGGADTGGGPGAGGNPGAGAPGGILIRI